MDNEAQKCQETICYCMASFWIFCGLIFLACGIIVLASGEVKFGIITILISMMPMTVGFTIVYCVRKHKSISPRDYSNDVQPAHQTNIPIHHYQQPENQVIFPWQIPSSTWNKYRKFSWNMIHAIYLFAISE